MTKSTKTVYECDFCGRVEETNFVPCNWYSCIDTQHGAEKHFCCEDHYKYWSCDSERDKGFTHLVVHVDGVEALNKWVDLRRKPS